MFEFSVNWIWVFCFALLALGGTYFFYQKDKLIASVSKPLKSVLFCLRFIVIFSLLFLLLNPILSAFKEFRQEPVLLFLTDNSESVAFSAKNSNELKQKIKQLKDKTSEIVPTDAFTFDKELNAWDSLNWKGKSTNFQNLHSDLENRYLHSNVAGIVLLTDGIATEGMQALDINWLGVPVFSIGMGDTVLKKDVLVKEIYHNKITFLNNEFPFEISGIAKNAKGENINITVFYDGVQKLKKTITIKDLQQEFSIAGKIKATTAGTHKITVQCQAIRGEVSIQNNSLSSYIDVLDERQRILILYQQPHPDIAAFKNSFLGNDNYQVLTQALKDAEQNLSSYNLVVVFGMPENKNEFKKWENLLMSSSANVLFMLNNSVNSSYFSKEVITIRNGNQQFNDALPVLNSNFNFFTFTKDEQRILSQYPPLSVPFGPISLPYENTPIFFQKIGSVLTDYPLITLGNFQQKKVAWILGEGFWRWKLQEAKNNVNGETPAFNQMVQQLSKYLYLKEEKSSFVLDYQKRFQEDENVIIKAQLYNKNFEKINTPEIYLELKDSKKNLFKYQMSKTMDDYKVDLGRFPPGEYELIAKTELNGKKVQKTGKFVVQEIMIESVDLQAKHLALRSISKLSGGKFYSMNNAYALLEDLKALETKDKVFYEKLKEELIHFRWLAILIIIISSIEWFLRKWYGTI